MIADSVPVGYFDRAAADRALNFFELILKHTQDEWSGKPFMLAPWEEDAISTIFGTLKDDGTPLIEMAYLEVPKKSGKTELAAGLVLLALILDTNLGCQVYGAAAAQRQALNVYRAARTMVDLSDDLKAELKVLHSTARIIKRNDPNSFYAAVAADGDLSDGVNPRFTVADEVHRWHTRKQLENWEVLSLGGITRRQAFTCAITTAGIQAKSPLAWRLHEKTRNIALGLIHDPTFYGRIYAADPSDDWTDEKTWIKANPSLRERGGFLDLGKYRQKYNAALGDPEAIRSFKRYFLNLWDQETARCIDPEKWELCRQRSPFVARPLAAREPEDDVRPIDHDLLAHFMDRTCFPGVDLSLTTDLSAVVFVFICDDGGVELLPFYYMPSANIRERELKDGMPFRDWAEKGWLELCEGSAIDYRDIKARLKWGGKMFDMREICFDPYNSREISTQLGDDGYTCVEISQGYATMNAPCKKFLEFVVTGKLYHGGHPLLKWNADCLSTQERSDLMKFVKPERNKSTARIDGVTAAVDGLARAILHLPDSKTIEVWG